MTQRKGGESPTRGPTEGTRHRRDKGIAVESPRLWREDTNIVRPARGCLMEVIGARPDRTKVKRRKAFVMGEPPPSGKAQYPYESRG